MDALIRPSRTSSSAARRVILLAVIFCLQTFPIHSAPQQGSFRADDTPMQIREMRSTIDDLRHQLNNHEAEIRMYDEKLSNLDTIIESVRDQLSDTSKSHKEQLKGSSTTLESKITALETTAKGLSNDMRQFKTYANDSTVALADYKLKIEGLAKSVEQQNQNIEHLQAAMRSLMQALNGDQPVASKSAPVASSTDAPPTATSGITYRIKAGDSLEKIARSHQTTIQALKELNGLTTDRIVVGKVLLIPDK